MKKLISGETEEGQLSEDGRPSLPPPYYFLERECPQFSEETGSVFDLYVLYNHTVPSGGISQVTFETSCLDKDRQETYVGIYDVVGTSDGTALTCLFGERTKCTQLGGKLISVLLGGGIRLEYVVLVMGNVTSIDNGDQGLPTPPYYLDSFFMKELECGEKAIDVTSEGRNVPNSLGLGQCADEPVGIGPSDRSIGYTVTADEAELKEVQLSLTLDCVDTDDNFSTETFIRVYEDGNNRDCVLSKNASCEDNSNIEVVVPAGNYFILISGAVDLSDDTVTTTMPEYIFEVKCFPEAAPTVSPVTSVSTVPTASPIPTIACNVLTDDLEFSAQVDSLLLIEWDLPF